MSRIRRAELNRIPGLPLAKQEDHRKDLTKLTQIELLEIKEREEKLLANKAHMQRLPDKGKRIKDFYDKILVEYERRSCVDEAAAMFSTLNIAAKGQNAMNELEWSGRLNELADPIDDVLDSDDETELDPLRILAQRGMHQRRIKVIPPPKTLITADDLVEIKSFRTDSPDSGLSNASPEHNSTSNGSSEIVDSHVISINVGEKLANLKTTFEKIQQTTDDNRDSRHSSISSTVPSTTVDEHTRYLVGKTELNVHPQRDKFKPYKTSITNVHDPEKERLRKHLKNWENTSATPPLLTHSGTKLITLLDSVDIQSQYLLKLRELQEKQAMERLAARNERLTNLNLHLPSAEILKSNRAFTDYRTRARTDNQIEGGQRYNEFDEVEDEEKGEVGGVNYSIIK